MNNRDLAAAWAYHNGTKHSLWSIRRNSHFLQGFGATAPTFYDDDVIKFFSPHAEGNSVIFHIAIGKSAAHTLP